MSDYDFGEKVTEYSSKQRYLSGCPLNIPRAEQRQ